MLNGYLMDVEWLLAGCSNVVGCLLNGCTKSVGWFWTVVAWLLDGCWLVVGWFRMVVDRFLDGCWMVVAWLFNALWNGFVLLAEYL